MKLTNADVQAALAAMVHVCCTGNRLDALASVRAYRIKETLSKAWEGVDAVRLQLCKDHGRLSEDGAHYEFDREGRAAFDDSWKKLLGEERELELETLTPAELDAGWFRTAEGKKERFDLSPEQRGVLIRVGIVTEPKEAD